jgi:hypothetical protein
MNYRTVRADHFRATGFSLAGGPSPVLPTQVPITYADSSGALAGDAKAKHWSVLIVQSSSNPTAPHKSIA